ncbi:SlyX family protein [Sneathiella limimaris]|uniref:SlyX family protein n=1 Tax=Sneathiella limimaris TaxID=1964213 RepID=UPI00146F5C58|nr:SlyX family protein [Sneathiella limimaris]
MGTEPETRLTEVELKLMDQEQAIADLSDMVNKQWQLIENLTAQLTSAKSRIVTLESHMPEGAQQAEKPPHY